MPIVAMALAMLGTTAPAQRQFDELLGRALPADTDLTIAVALGDVDGDGDLDLFCGNVDQDRLYRNDGSGNYTDATAELLPTGGSGPRAVAMGDVDGDGDLDIVLGNPREQDQLYLNDGTGTYSDVTAERMPPDSELTYAVALGDVDGDDDLDLILGIEGRQQNRLYINDGAGTFSDATETLMPVVGDSTRSVALGDIDGDDDLDLVVGNNGQSRLYLNDGTGTFTEPAVQLPELGAITNTVLLGDVDGDGDLDLATGNNGRNRLYLNDGTGTYTDATAERIPGGADFHEDLALGDVDGDGDLDMLMAVHGTFSGNNRQNKLYRNDGTGFYTDDTEQLMPADPDHSFALALGDVDGDADLDVVFGNRGEQNRLYLNDGGGTYADTIGSRMPSHADETRDVALGDVDGDGDLDMVLAVAEYYDRQNRLYLNDGTGTYSDATARVLPVDDDETHTVALGDVDVDGDLDIVFGNWGAQNRLYLNDGTGSYTDALVPFVGDTTHALVLGDIDGDRDLDLITANAGGRLLFLNTGTGAGTYTPAHFLQVPAVGGRAGALALGDVDGDGDLDMVVGVSRKFGGDNRNLLHINDGTGSYTDATAAQMPAHRDESRALALGDVDGDGDLDIVFGNFRGQNRLCLNDGTGTYTDASSERLPIDGDDTETVALGDVDDDGDLDILLGASGFLRRQTRLYLNDGGGSFTDASAERISVIGREIFAAALGDMDGDRDLDAVFGIDGPDRVLLNLVRQLDSPFLLIPGRRYRLDGYARSGPMRPGDVALAYLSTGSASSPLPPFGTIGIDLSRSAALPPFFIPQPEGMGSVSFTVPNQPGLIGMSVYAQALLVPFGGAWHLTNVTVDPIVR